MNLHFYNKNGAGVYILIQAFDLVDNRVKIEGRWFFTLGLGSSVPTVWGCFRCLAVRDAIPENAKPIDLTDLLGVCLFPQD